MRFSILVPAVATWVLAAACGSTRLYEGDALPSHEVIELVVGGKTPEGYWAEIDYVDGKPVPEGVLELLPGKHVLEGRAGQRSRSVPGGPFALSFQGRPGTSYRLDPIRLRLKRRLAVELVDVRTDERVTWSETRAEPRPQVVVEDEPSPNTLTD